MNKVPIETIKWSMILYLIVFCFMIIMPVAAHSVVTFELRAGGSAVDKEVYVKPVDAESVWTIVNILPYGQSAPIPLDPDTYRVGVTDGNGGQPESQIFKLGEDEHKVVVLLGHAVSSSHKGTHEDGPDEPVEPVCITTKEWIPGYYTEEKVWECYGYSRQSCKCEWITKCVWHPGHWESKTVCK